MRVLFVGGTGNISPACVDLAAARGYETYVLNRGTHMDRVSPEAKLLKGDHSQSAVFDNSKIRRFVPDFQCTVPFAEGARRAVRWFDADPARRVHDAAYDAAIDRLLCEYRK